ncbi:hypothetical protein [Thiomicrorhabdus aquaedulcis]|uniref:hypothetical protein n=1 Tax=Thiomicrorhabdus aquaedulcis TaxID=2211106 RepID=UPI000FD6F5D8|nr:hypothetical protein [Thiomicrorhabdus aquaedulcis]
MQNIILTWVLWIVIHPILVLLWPFIFSILKFMFLDVGKKGFTTLMLNLSSTMIWLGVAIISLNIAKSNPGLAASWGVKLDDVIIQWKWAVPLLIFGIFLNAIANKWLKE